MEHEEATWEPAGVRVILTAVREYNEHKRVKRPGWANPTVQSLWTTLNERQRLLAALEFALSRQSPGVVNWIHEDVGAFLEAVMLAVDENEKGDL